MYHLSQQTTLLLASFTKASPACKARTTSNSAYISIHDLPAAVIMFVPGQSYYCIDAKRQRYNLLLH